MNKKYLLQGISMLVITIIYLFIAFHLGIPLAVKIADIVQKDKSVGKNIMTTVLAPRLNYLPAATNSAEINVSGYSFASQTVDIYLNDKKETTVNANADGFFKKNITLSLGSNNIYAIAKNNTGQTSQPSNKLRVNFLEIAPELVVIEPVNGQEFKQKDNYIYVKGVTEVGLTLKVNGKIGVINNNGEFTYRLGLSEGENTIMVEVMDAAGNSKKESLTVTFKKK